MTGYDHAYDYDRIDTMVDFMHVLTSLEIFPANGSWWQVWSTHPTEVYITFRDVPL